MEINNLNNTYIAMMDVLGFKSLVKKNSHEELQKIYKSLITTTNDSLSLYKYNKEVTEKGVVHISPNFERTIINSLIISDSILLWTNNIDARSFFDLILTVRFMLFHSMHVGIPLRGGIDIGPLTRMTDLIQPNSQVEIRVNTFFGESIVDVYSLEKCQEWSGCMISQKCINLYEKSLLTYLDLLDDPNRMNHAVGVVSLIRRGFICKYDVPLKGNKTANEYVINWPSVTSNMRLPEQSIRNSFAKHNKSVEGEEIQRKIQNTVDFLTAAPAAQPIKKF